MKINKTKIEKRIKRKKDPFLVETILQLKKTNPLLAKELAKPKRRWPSINLKEVDIVKGDVLIVGKILGAGEVSKPKKIVGWSASEKALEKIKESGGTFIALVEEIKKNPELKGYSIIR